MDLDNIKKAWKDSDNTDPVISTEQIEKAVAGKGKGAFMNLIKYEKIGFIVLLLCIPMSFVFKHPVLISTYLTTIFFGTVWQIYKYRYLKSTDMMNMSILEVSSRITTYKGYIHKEIIVSIIWAMSFGALCIYYTFSKSISGRENELMYILAFFAGLIIYVGLIIFLIYHFLYKKNLKNLEKYIQEIKEFEEGNI